MKTRVIVLLIVLVLLALGITGVQAQDGGNGSLRFVHVIPGVAAIDIYTDGQLTVSNLDYGQASNYISVPTGTHEITVRPGGIGTILWQQQVISDPNIPQTLIASAIDPLNFVTYEDDFSAAAFGNTRFKAIHAISGGPNLELQVQDQTVDANWQYGVPVGAFDIPADVYELTAFVAGNPESIILPLTPFSLVNGTSHLLIAYGTPSVPRVLLLSTPLDGDANSGFVRLAHTIADAPEVDVFANDTLIAPGLGFGDITEHLALPAGDYSIELRLREDGSVVSEATLAVEAQVAVTVSAIGTALDLALNVSEDNISGITGDQALISVTNTIPGDSSVSVALADGTSLADDLAFGETSEAVSIDPSKQDVTLSLTLNGQSATLSQGVQILYGGIYYNVLALSGSLFTPPTLKFAPTSLSQGIASAPGAKSVIIAVAPTLPPQVEVTSVIDTEVVTPEPTTNPIDVVVEVAPTLASTPPSVLPPGIIPDEAPITARIILDPGANLQLRQLPSRDALSLGLAPSGSSLVVNGRLGAPQDIDGNVLQVTDENGQPVDWVDPVTLLNPEDPQADLLPAETWINVTYTTPDGGQIEAWTLAQYLNIRDNEAKQVPLRNLSTVPQNRAGEASNTEVTPPPVAKDRVTVRVFNLDSGVNLNIRRTAEVGGEVLARVPTGTVLDFEGIGESGSWAFVRLTTAEGAEITGWVNTTYIQYELNGSKVDLERLTTLNLLTTIEEASRRGSVGVNAPTISQPTRDPLRDAFVTLVQLDAGANLNLRRNPNDQAEVLARIPSGTSIILEGQNEDGTWYRTSFEGISGWIASGFVFTITFNGAPVDKSALPIISTIPTPTPTPTSTPGQ